MTFFLRSLQSSGMLLQFRRAGIQGTEVEGPYLTIYLQMGRVKVTSSAKSPVLSVPAFVSNGEKQLLQVDVEDGQVFFIHEGWRFELGSLPDLEVHEGDLVYVGGLPGGDTAEWGGHLKGCLQDLRLDDVHLDLKPWDGPVNDTVYVASDAENVLSGCISDDKCKVRRHAFNPYTLQQSYVGCKECFAVCRCSLA